VGAAAPGCSLDAGAVPKLATPVPEVGAGGVSPTEPMHRDDVAPPIAPDVLDLFADPLPSAMRQAAAANVAAAIDANTDMPAPEPTT
jgi:hypothetical protein